MSAVESRKFLGRYQGKLINVTFVLGILCTLHMKMDTLFSDDKEQAHGETLEAFALSCNPTLVVIQSKHPCLERLWIHNTDNVAHSLSLMFLLTVYQKNHSYTCIPALLNEHIILYNVGKKHKNHKEPLCLYMFWELLYVPFS